MPDIHTSMFSGATIRKWSPVSPGCLRTCSTTYLKSPNALAQHADTHAYREVLTGRLPQANADTPSPPSSSDEQKGRLRPSNISTANGAGV